MSKRQYTTYRVPSDEVQGEGSYVVLSYITRIEAKTYFAKGLSDDDLLEQHVIEWDWSGSDGKPLNDPTDGGLGQLVDHERLFLIEHLFHPDTLEAEKNSETG